MIFGGTNAGLSSTIFLRQCQFQFHQCYKVTHTFFDKWSADPMKIHLLQRHNSPSRRVVKYALSNTLQEFLSLSVVFQPQNSFIYLANGQLYDPAVLPSWTSSKVPVVEETAGNGAEPVFIF